jgi:Fur family ferric uptake transcriptional regulator
MAHTATWSESAQQSLRAAGLRSGGARRAVIDYLGAQDCCVSVQEIHAGVSRAGRNVGIASVYRVLDELAAHRLVQRVDVGDGIARYEPALHEHHHHHVVCDDCGRVDPFSDETLERAIERAAGRLGYAVEGHEVVLRGTCGECRAA